ncbi:MAG: hypothetical protein QY314_03480 [Candidatus Dojkabacteria bacterium]|nr:MAG: hypothetical protein QY314_03480 [Candidatus Dojkabacteria bacterium]
MAETAIFIIASLVVLYMGWYIHVTTFSKLRSLGNEHDYSYLDYFDSILKSGIGAVIFARIGWIAMNLETVMTYGFGVLPYERIGRDFEWFPTYPWRFFMFSEGILSHVFWVSFGILLFILLVIPTVKLITALKVGKARIKGMLYGKEAVFIVSLAVYCAALAAWSMRP